MKRFTVILAIIILQINFVYSQDKSVYSLDNSITHEDFIYDDDRRKWREPLKGSCWTIKYGLHQKTKNYGIYTPMWTFTCHSGEGAQLYYWDEKYFSFINGDDVYLKLNRPEKSIETGYYRDFYTTWTKHGGKENSLRGLHEALDEVCGCDNDSQVLSMMEYFTVRKAYSDTNSDWGLSWSWAFMNENINREISVEENLKILEQLKNGEDSKYFTVRKAYIDANSDWSWEFINENINREISVEENLKILEQLKNGEDNKNLTTDITFYGESGNLYMYKINSNGDSYKITLTTESIGNNKYRVYVQHEGISGKIDTYIDTVKLMENGSVKCKKRDTGSFRSKIETLLEMHYNGCD